MESNGNRNHNYITNNISVYRIVLIRYKCINFIDVNIVSDYVLKMSRSSQEHDGDMEILFYERSYDKIKYKDS